MLHYRKESAAQNLFKMVQKSLQSYHLAWLHYSSTSTATFSYLQRKEMNISYQINL